MTFHCKSIEEWFDYDVKKNITNVTIGNEVETIGNKAFYGFSSLTSIEIPNSVTTIGDRAFYGCSGLTSIDIPNSVTSIGGSAFSGCSGLTSIDIPNSVTSIGYEVFKGCTGLSSIEIPNSVTTIGDYAFEDCTGLTSIEIPTSVVNISPRAFNNTAWYNSLEDGMVYINNIAYRYKGTMPDGEKFAIKEGTRKINEYAFNGCTGMASIEIPNSVTSIGDAAFSGCRRLFELFIPNSVKNIGDYAFNGCDLLYTLWIGRGVKSIGASTFNNCTNLADVYCLADKVPDFSGYENGTIPVTLHVPAELMYDYRSHSSWNAFSKIVPLTEEEKAMGIDNISSREAEVKDVYDLGGRNINQLKQGVNIIRTKDGKTRKVLVK